MTDLSLAWQTPANLLQIANLRPETQPEIFAAILDRLEKGDLVLLESDDINADSNTIVDAYCRLISYETNKKSTLDTCGMQEVFGEMPTHIKTQLAVEHILEIMPIPMFIEKILTPIVANCTRAEWNSIYQAVNDNS